MLSRPELRQKRAREPASRRGAEGQGPHVTSRQTARLRSAGSAPLKLPAHGGRGASAERMAYSLQGPFRTGGARLGLPEGRGRWGADPATGD